METLNICGVSLPLPDGWLIEPDGRYLGEGGLLDVRVCHEEKPINEERRALAAEHLSASGATVKLLRIQGFTCLFCRYRSHEVLVVNYSFDIDPESEVRAVYTFLPGHEQIAQLLAQQLGHAAS